MVIIWALWKTIGSAGEITGKMTQKIILVDNTVNVRPRDIVEIQQVGSLSTQEEPNFGTDDNNPFADQIA